MGGGVTTSMLKIRIICDSIGAQVAVGVLRLCPSHQGGVAVNAVNRRGGLTHFPNANPLRHFVAHLPPTWDAFPFAAPRSSIGPSPSHALSMFQDVLRLESPPDFLNPLRETQSKNLSPYKSDTTLLLPMAYLPLIPKPSALGLNPQPYWLSPGAQRLSYFPVLPKPPSRSPAASSSSVIKYFLKIPWAQRSPL